MGLNPITIKQLVKFFLNKKIKHLREFPWNKRTNKCNLSGKQVKDAQTKKEKKKNA